MCYQLTNNLYSKNEVGLTLDEFALLEDRIAAIYNSPLIVGDRGHPGGSGAGGTGKRCEAQGRCQ